MKIDVPWPFLSESVARFITPLYQFITKIRNFLHGIFLRNLEPTFNNII